MENGRYGNGEGRRDAGRHRAQNGRRREAMVVKGKPCPWGVCCKHGLRGKCIGEHGTSEQEAFAQEKAVLDRKRNAACAYCVKGVCRHAKKRGGCWRGLGSGDSDYDESDEEDHEQANHAVNTRQLSAMDKVLRGFVCEPCEPEEAEWVSIFKGQELPSDDEGIDASGGSSGGYYECLQGEWNGEDITLLGADESHDESGCESVLSQGMSACSEVVTQSDDEAIQAAIDEAESRRMAVQQQALRTAVKWMRQDRLVRGPEVRAGEDAREQGGIQQGGGKDKQLGGAQAVHAPGEGNARKQASAQALLQEGLSRWRLVMEWKQELQRLVRAFAHQNIATMYDEGCYDSEFGLRLDALRGFADDAEEGLPLMLYMQNKVKDMFRRCHWWRQLQLKRKSSMQRNGLRAFMENMCMQQVHREMLEKAIHNKEFATRILERQVLVLVMWLWQGLVQERRNAEEMRNAVYFVRRNAGGDGCRLSHCRRFSTVGGLLEIWKLAVTRRQQAIETLGTKWAAIRYGGYDEFNSYTSVRAIRVVRDWRALVGEWKRLRKLGQCRMVVHHRRILFWWKRRVLWPKHKRKYTIGLNK